MVPVTGQVKTSAIALVLSVVVVLGTGAVKANPRDDNVNALFRVACDLYEKGDFDSALVQFDAIKVQGMRNASVYYNLGNCYYREGHVGRAVANYRRALMLSPRDSDIKANLNLIRTSVGSGDTTAAYGLGGVTAFPLRLISPRRLQEMFYVAYYLAAIFFLGVLFLKNRLRRVGLYGLVASVVVTACAFGLSQHGISKFKSASEAVVITDQTELKSGPGNAFEEIATLADGLELRLRARSGMWLEVRLPTGEVGWVREKDIETI
jgi:tetratricopeptide (TPR) repeat protein